MLTASENEGAWGLHWIWEDAMATTQVRQGLERLVQFSTPGQEDAFLVAFIGQHLLGSGNLQELGEVYPWPSILELMNYVGKLINMVEFTQSGDLVTVQIFSTQLLEVLVAFGVEES